MCNHVTIVPPLRALLESPDLRLDGFIGPGHVSTVVGARPFEFIPADYGKPVVVSGFEPARPPAVGADDPAPARATGRCEVENQYSARRARTRATCARCEVMAEVFALRPHFEWRGLGFISQSALRLSDAYARPRRRAALRGARRARRRPQGVPVRRGAQGRHQALGVQGLRHARARPSTRSARAWSRRRAPAPPTTTTGASPASGRSCEWPSAVVRPRAARPRHHRDRARQARRGSRTSTSRWPTARAARRRRR